MLGSNAVDQILWHQQVRNYTANYGTQVQPFTVTVPATGDRSFDIGKKFPTNIEWIYGISLKINGVGPDNETLITRANAADMFLNLQQGSYFFLENFPLDSLIYIPGEGATDSYRDTRYLPVKISGRADLDTSSIGNPAGVNSGTIVLYLWYLGSAFNPQSNV